MMMRAFLLSTCRKHGDNKGASEGEALGHSPILLRLGASSLVARKLA